jgi:hypothetical protein
MSPDRPGPVVVARFRDLDEALLAQMRLDAAGIDADLLDENMVRMNWAYSLAIGGIRLAVAAEDEDAAREVLASEAPLDETAAETADEGVTPLEPEPSKARATACPRCGSFDTRLDPDRRLQKGSILLTILLPFALMDRLLPRKQCAQCGRRWR